MKAYTIRMKNWTLIRVPKHLFRKSFKKSMCVGGGVFSTPPYYLAVIGTIPSIPIPIPFANFGIGIDPQFKLQSWNWCHNSNSHSTEWGGFQGIPMFVLKSVEKVVKTCEPGVTSSLFELPVTPGWREGNSNMWNPLESPQFRGIWSWSWPPNSVNGVGIGAFQKSIPNNRNWSMELWIDPNSFPMTAI